MLFNSYAFIFAFLPIVGIGYFWLARRATNLALVWLLLSSMLFYGWWSWSYLGLIVASFVANYLFAIFLAQHRSLILLSFGVGLNLAVLGWFKYANFTADNLNVLFDLGINLAPIVLPLAISFHTFQQIAYLVDVKRGVEPEPNLLRYGLFVCFFPQLLAGPIVHHHEMLPQLKGWRQALRHEDLAVGVTIFLIGLAKKTLIADRMAAYASPMFDAAATGLPISLLDAWAGVLAYTLQIYFDFSGYSDMAIGLARMFGIRLPMNFNSPYKAASIIEFWRRWHITLSRFLRDYLYVPLGGNRHGGGRRYANLMVVMLLGGLWHGANWTFVVWGGLHGLYLALNHGWHRLSADWRVPGPSWPWRAMGWLLTFLCVMLAWVFFRAANFDTALNILTGMVAGEGRVVVTSSYLTVFKWLEPVLGAVQYSPQPLPYFDGREQVLWSLGFLAIALFLPNTQQWMADFQPVLDNVGTRTALPSWMRWRPRPIWAVLMVVLGCAGIIAAMQPSEFIYWQF